MDKITATIPFTGFYDSWHAQCVDDALISCMDWEGTGEPDSAFTPEQVGAVQEAMDYKKAYTEYAELYAEAALRCLNDALGGDTAARIEWQFESLDSPKFYNFTTDRIFVTIPLPHLRALRTYAGDDFMQTALDARFTPRDGFSPFYTTDLEAWDAKPLSEYDHNEAGTVIEAAIMRAFEFTATAGEKHDDPMDAYRNEVYTDYLNHQSPSAGDTAVEAGLGQAGWDIINAVYEKQGHK